MVNMWMVKAGENSFLIDNFKKLNLVAIGWSLGDLTDKNDEEIEKLYRNQYGNTNSLHQVLRFKNLIEVDDYVISLNKKTNMVCLGRITSDYYWSDELSNIDSYGIPYCHVRSVKWLCEIQIETLNQLSQDSLKTQFTVFKIKDKVKEDILKKCSNEIKQIRTMTLSNKDFDCETYQKTVDFLSNVLINRNECHFHYNRRPINLVGRTLILFKYEGKLIGKGIFIDDVESKVIINNKTYNGYYLVEKDSIEIFNESIDLNEIKKYVPVIKTLSRDQTIDIKYLDEVNLMIEKHLKGNETNNKYLSSKVIKNYLNENNLGNFKQDSLEEIFLKFRKEFGPDVLEKLEGMDLINKMFLHDSDKNNLCYKLEFSQDYTLGGIGGGSAYKYYLFKSGKTQKWMSGSSRNQKSLTDEEAIEIGTKIRDAIVNGAKYIKSIELNTIEDFNRLENDLGDIFKDCIAKPTASWIHKYYLYLFPDKFIGIHSYNMKEDFLYKFRIEPENGYYAMDGQFYQLAEKSNIKLYSLLDNRIVSLFFESDDQWKTIDEGRLIDFDDLEFSSDFKRNLIYFGAPGTGKSFNLNLDKNELLKDYENNYERVTFHPDYAYANFVGTYKPVPEADSITYKYVPGPFIRILTEALNHPNKPYLLIIEEINRANVAGVFGDVFQLLDRDESHSSQYPINSSQDLKKYLKDKLNKDYDKIIIPSNMFIWATMNSADQGVFPIDTAFKRRWDFKYFSINNNEYLVENISVDINGVDVNWNSLRKAINDELLSYKINEDKLMGPFFAFNEFINKDVDDETFKDIFKNKIIMYLFEDAARSRRNELFSGISKNTNLTYSQICDEFDKIGIEIFTESIKEKFIKDDGE